MALPEPDALRQLRRGAVTVGWNLGLRSPQAHAAAPDVFNQGCHNPIGCKSRGEAACVDPGSLRRSASLQRLFDRLNAPLLDDAADTRPPDYMMQHKRDTANAVSGWSRTEDGSFVWEKGLPRRSCSTV